MANAEIKLCPILATAASCTYLSLAIANKDIFTLGPYQWFLSARNKVFGLVETRVHAALAMPATLGALGSIPQALLALCPCGPRLPRGEMQAAPCGARSNKIGCSRPLPPSLLTAGIRSVRQKLVLSSRREQIGVLYVRKKFGDIAR